MLFGPHSSLGVEDGERGMRLAVPKEGNVMTLYCTMLCYTILYYIVLYSTLLYSTLLYSTILYYTILYYTILDHTRPEDPTRIVNRQKCVQLRIFCLSPQGQTLFLGHLGLRSELVLGLGARVSFRVTVRS
jgi:hypothetical protein